MTVFEAPGLRVDTEDITGAKLLDPLTWVGLACARHDDPSIPLRAIHVESVEGQAETVVGTDRHRLHVVRRLRTGRLPGDYDRVTGLPVEGNFVAWGGLWPAMEKLTYRSFEIVDMPTVRGLLRAAALGAEAADGVGGAAESDHPWLVGLPGPEGCVLVKARYLEDAFRGLGRLIDVRTAGRFDPVHLTLADFTLAPAREAVIMPIRTPDEAKVTRFDLAEYLMERKA